MTILEFTDKYGNIIKATGNPRSGGEGDVYDVEGNPDLVIKVYNDKKRNKDKKLYNELITKIQAMCDICDDTIMRRAGWPQQIVYLGNKPLGFTMNKIKYCNTFHQLVDTIDRKEKFLDNNWKYSLYVAYNLACAVNALHKKNVVIGDINESNFLIGNRTIAETNGVFNFKDNGIVYSIDCDSFQISTNNKAFLCSVAKAEYLPPELVGANLHKVVRTPNHDNFGLAVLIFQLVMLGRHPYMGIGVPGNITEAISGGYYVYGKNAKSKGVYPPKPDGLYDAIFSSMNNEMKSLFEQAFSSQPNVVRPSAETWINALKRQIDDLVQCDEDENHYYDKDGECIWCKIKQEFGFNPWEIKPKSIINQNSGYNYSQIAYTPSVNANNKVVLSNTNNPTVSLLGKPLLDDEEIEFITSGSNNKFLFWLKFVAYILIKEYHFFMSIFKWMFKWIFKPFSFLKNMSFFKLVLLMSTMFIFRAMPFTNDTIETWQGFVAILSIIGIIIYGFKNKKPFKAILLFFILLFIVTISTETYNIDNSESISYIMEENRGAHKEYKNNKQIIKEIKTEESGLENYLKDSSDQQNKDMIFLAFYNNIDRLSDKYSPISKYASLKEPLTENEFFVNNAIEYHTIVKDNKITGIEIVDPRTNLYKFHIDEHTLYFYPVVNAEYLKQKYGQYLSKPVNEFLQLQISFYNDLNNRVYNNVVDEWYEGEKYPYPNKEMLLAKWIKSNEDFLRKYSDFPMKEYIKDCVYAFKNQTSINKYSKNTNFIFNSTSYN